MCYHKILVGVNFTESCKDALIQAKSIAEKGDISIEAMHIVPTVELNRYVSYYYFDSQSLLKNAQEKLESFVTDALETTEGIKLNVTEATPHYLLPSYAKSHNFDLLVLGADHFSSDIKQRGNFTLRCVRHSDVATLIVIKPTVKEFRSITLCSDLSEASSPMLQHISKLTRHQDAQANVEILHASSPPWLRERLLSYFCEKLETEEQKQQYEQLIQVQLTHLEKEAGKILKKSSVTTHCFETADPAKGILDYISESESDLMVLGRAGHGLLGLKTNILGSVTDYLIKHSPKSLLIVPSS